ncbi:MAG: DUF5329 domain-containing protein [Moraxellaceae bacterium]|nr:DUF5329 domain-containing protein [Moraxellaceae bacterium]
MSFAEALPAATKAEINQLFTALETSNCEFSRNGIWYSAYKASGHLHRKYDYLLRKGLVTTTESFIKLAATQSSTTGKLYFVRCDNKEPVLSNFWLIGKLKEIRRLPLNINN